MNFRSDYEESHSPNVAGLRNVRKIKNDHFSNYIKTRISHEESFMSSHKKRHNESRFSSIETKSGKKSSKLHESVVQSLDESHIAFLQRKLFKPARKRSIPKTSSQPSRMNNEIQI